MSDRLSYTRGLHELGDGLHAFLQPDGGWGWSNAGLIVADGASLLIDTLFDLTLTAEMLETMRPLLARSPLSGAFNTHGNGDHCYGNQLLPDGLPIYATDVAAEEIRAVPPTAAHVLFKETDLGADFVAWAREAFGPFDWTGIEARPPTDTFEGEMTLHVGGREVRLIAVGPAHTSGDAIAYVPDAAAVFTGDILFAASTPVMWAGPVSSWIAAADAILSLEPTVIVPGHGPLATPQMVRDLQAYLRFVQRESRRCFAAGIDAVAAADDIDLGPYANWSDAERIAVNVEMVYRELDPGRPAVSVPELFARMASWKARHRQRAS
jgi:glyoxylase-like metal-dependent hydrolase (beta-lactamase superfamily II)